MFKLWTEFIVEVNFFPCHGCITGQRVLKYVKFVVNSLPLQLAVVGAIHPYVCDIHIDKQNQRLCPRRRIKGCEWEQRRCLKSDMRPFRYMLIFILTFLGKTGFPTQVGEPLRVNTTLPTLPESGEMTKADIGRNNTRTPQLGAGAVEPY